MGDRRLRAAPPHRQRRRGRAEEPGRAIDQSHRRVPRVSVSVAARTEPVATPVAKPRSIEPSPPEPAATPPGAGAGAACDATEESRTASARQSKPAPIAPPEPPNARDRDAFARRAALRRRPLVARANNPVNEGDVVLVPAADLAKFGSLVYARKTDGSDREGYVPHKFVREGSRR